MNNYELWKNNENLDPILKEELSSNSSSKFL